MRVGVASHACAHVCVTCTLKEKKMLPFRVFLRRGVARRRAGYDKRALSEGSVSPESLMEEYRQKKATLHSE